jgi:hypothetical protein
VHPSQEGVEKSLRPPEALKVAFSHRKLINLLNVVSWGGAGTLSASEAAGTTTSFLGEADPLFLAGAGALFLVEADTVFLAGTGALFLAEADDVFLTGKGAFFLAEAYAVFLAASYLKGGRASSSPLEEAGAVFLTEEGDMFLAGAGAMFLAGEDAGFSARAGAGFLYGEDAVFSASADAEGSVVSLEAECLPRFGATFFLPIPVDQEGFLAVGLLVLGRSRGACGSSEAARLSRFRRGGVVIVSDSGFLEIRRGGGGRGLISAKACVVKEERGLKGRRGSYIRAGQTYLMGL